MLLLFALLLGGGGFHVPFLVAVIEAVAVFVLLPSIVFGEYRHVGPGGRAALIWIGFVLLVGLVQLVPLPSSIWRSLPGRNLLADSLALEGHPDVAWSISLAPQSSWTSLLAFLPPIALFVAVLPLRWSDRRKLVKLTLLVAIASTLLGLLQVSGDSNDATFNLYRLSPYGLSVGFFANKNQQALFMASALSLTVAMWLEATRHGRIARPIWMTALSIMFVTCGIGASSRTGAAFLAFATLSSLFFWQRRQIRRHGGLPSRLGVIGAAGLFRLLLRAGLVVVVLGLVGLAMTKSYQFERLARLFGQTDEDARFAFWPDVLYVMEAYFPVGVGFGNFDQVFQASEPLQSLHVWRVNHAHNDYLELIIECGALAIAILAGFALWFGQRLIAVWRVDIEEEGGALMRSAAVIILIVLLHSLVEYPLRTETISCLFAMACAFLVKPLGSSDRRPAGLRSVSGKVKEQAVQP